MSTPLYELDAITHRYGNRTILSIDHWEIARGDLVALVGPNGAGKSTLLRLLNFIEAPSEGSLRYKGHIVGSRNAIPLALRREVTTVFQRPILLDRSVQANVAYGLRLRGQRFWKERVERALEQVGLASLAHRPARHLSGGEAQRVALARAIVLEPEVLLLDEPTANLDPYNARLIEEIVTALNRERGTTIILVTHNIFQARRLARTVGLLLEGCLIEVDEVKRFFESPRDPRTAAFVRGEMIY